MNVKAISLGAVLAIATILFIAVPTEDVDAADGDVCTVNGTAYKTLSEAVASAGDGDIITLTSDVEVNNPVTIDKSVILDLNGHSVINNVVSERAFIVTASSFTVDGTDAGSLMTIPESNTGSFGFVKVAAASTVKFVGGTYIGDTDNGAFVKILCNDTLDASGSTVIFSDVSMSSNGCFFNTDTLNTDDSTPTLIVYGGSYNSETKAFGVDTINLSPVEFTDATVVAGTGPCIEASGSVCTYIDCDFTVTGNPNDFGTTAVAVSWMGTAVIDGGTYISTGYGAYVYSSGGTITILDGTVEGGTAALRADVDSGTYSDAKATVFVEGGYTDGAWQTNGNPNVSIVATGGRHSADVTEYLADGYTVVGNLVISVGYEEDGNTVSGDSPSASVETTDDNVTVVVTENVVDASVSATLQPSGTGSSSDIAGTQMDIIYNGDVAAGGLTFKASRVDASSEPSVSTDNMVGLFDISIDGVSDSFNMTATIRVDVPSGSFISNAWVVFYPEKGGEPEVYEATVDGDAITFTADHCSLWGFYAEFDEEPAIWDDEEDLPPFIPSQTGGDDDTVTIVACAAAAAVAAIMAVFLIIDRKQ